MNQIINEIKTKFADNNFSSAAENCEKAIITPEGQSSFVLHSICGLSYIQLGNLARAEILLVKATSLDANPQLHQKNWKVRKYHKVSRYVNLTLFEGSC